MEGLGFKAKQTSSLEMVQKIIRREGVSVRFITQTFY